MKNHMKIFSFMTFHRKLLQTGAKPLHIKFDKVDLFIRVFDGTRYLVLFGPEKYDNVSNRIYLSQKSGITCFFLFLNMQKWKLIHMILYI